jgi:hypothetical protein
VEDDDIVLLNGDGVASEHSGAAVVTEEANGEQGFPELGKDIGFLGGGW